MTKQAIILGLLAIGAQCLSSCGSHGQVVRADDYDQETIVDIMNEDSPQVSANGHKRQGMPGNAVRQSTPIDGRWVIIRAGGKEIVADDMPYAIFDNGKLYASNGCNAINGNFTYKDRKATFSNILSTMALCPDVEYQGYISATLNDGVTVNTRVEQVKRESYLYLSSTDGTALLTLRKDNLEVLSGQWDIVEIYGDKVGDDEGVNVFFDITERKVHGNTGCNYFNGAITVDPTVSSSISFSDMDVTTKPCKNGETESKMLVALEETQTYNLKNHDTLTLDDSEGKVLVTLRRAEVKK